MLISLIGSHENYVPCRENIFGVSEIFFSSLKDYQKNMTQWRILTENVLESRFSWIGYYKILIWIELKFKLNKLSTVKVKVISNIRDN